VNAAIICSVFLFYSWAIAYSLDVLFGLLNFMNDKFRLGIVFTHPTQHHGPLWRKLAEQPELSVKVLYISSENQSSGDPFLGGKAQAWDVDLLDGYEYEYLKDLSGKVPTKRVDTTLSP
jgi:hypothetical protein